MLKFFRKVRHKMLIDNKITKYLLYAFGEILLVMIGILLALQVNNWNTENFEKKAANKLMHRLLVESNLNKVALNENIQLLDSLMTDAESLLQFIGKDYLEKDEETINLLIYSILTSPRLKIKLSTLEEALSSGELALISADSLRDYLYQIPSLYADIERTQEIENEDGSTNFVPYLYDNISLREVDYTFAPIKNRIGKSKLDDTDNRIILKDRKFENMVDNKMFLLNNLLIRNSIYNELNNKIIELLEQETENYNQ